MIKAHIIKSAVVKDAGVDSEIVTCILTYPRFIHAEFMTHRTFSRNAASSRAIPIKRMIREVIKNPATPLYWGRNKKGMQASEEHQGFMRWLAVSTWLWFRWFAVAGAWALDKLQVHKQIANRLLEPWSHITVIMTTGHAGLMNFFKLRAHPDAQPEFQVLAYFILEAYLDPVRTVDVLAPGEYYVPMLTTTEWMELKRDGKIDEAIKIACGRIARVSYLTHDGKSSPVDDIALNNRLEFANPVHASPFESVAIAEHPADYGTRNGNLPKHWCQHRKSIPNESVSHMESGELQVKLQDRPDWVHSLFLRSKQGIDSRTNSWYRTLP